jgi:solute carrier family 25 S-adenosylmethionine transporter 26
MRGQKLKNITPQRLLRGADAQFLMSLPHGALYFYVIEEVKDFFSKFWPKNLNFFSDFMCSSISTLICSIVSTPQMVVTDRLMADIYPSFITAVQTIYKHEGILGFYSGWLLFEKIQ